MTAEPAPDPRAQVAAEALAADCWEGHDEPLTMDDLRHMADVAIRALDAAAPEEQATRDGGRGERGGS